MSNETDVAMVVADLRDRWGTLDGLINNAGVARMVPVALTPAATARQVMEVNFMGTFLLTNACLRLLKRSAAGRIVNLTSVAVPLRLEGEALYAAAKSAIETFTRVVAKEFGPMGITCNAVGPSPIRTDLLQKVPEEKLDAIIQRQAIKRWATVDDVVQVVDFFLDAKSSMITGQIIYLVGLGRRKRSSSPRSRGKRGGYRWLSSYLSG